MPLGRIDHQPPVRKVRRRDKPCTHRVHENCPIERGEGLPRFTRPLGLDFIITPDGRTVLIELQHGFGRLGLLKLFPAANRRYRKRFRTLLRDTGTCFEVTSGIRAICRDKIATYRRFAEYQPSSFAYRRWGPRVEEWLDGLEEELILAKPPLASCGKGIRVFGRQAFSDAAGSITLPTPILLQAFTQCRPLHDADGRDHVGCIRHIVMMCSDGGALDFIHLPSYWRVSSTPRVWSVTSPDKDALTANISRGAYPVGVDECDEVTIRALAEEICTKLIVEILNLSELRQGSSQVISGDGGLGDES